MNGRGEVQEIYERLRAVVACGLSAAQAVRERCEHGGTLERYDLTAGGGSLRGNVQGADLVPLISVLTEAARAGHVVRAATEPGGSTLEITWSRTGEPLVELDGSPDGLAGHRGAELQRNVSDQNADAVLVVLPETTFEVTLDLVLAVDGGLWVPSPEDLVARLGDGRWASTLLRAGTGRGRSVIMVQGAEGDVLRCPGLVLAGPEVGVERLRPHRTIHPHRHPGWRADYEVLPSPHDLDPERDDAGSLEPLRSVLAAVARACCWYWLGRRSRTTTEGVTTVFEGARTMTLDLLPVPGRPTDAETRLFAWATAVDDPARDDAVHQAVSLAVWNQGHLSGAAGGVLRTARTIDEVARRGLVTEALAARRAVREAATTSARSAASVASGTATKTVEQSVALLIALAVALFANGQKFLSTVATSCVVISLAALAIVALSIALKVTLSSARGALAAFDTDLGLYREALSEDDLTAVKNLAVITSARDDLHRARTTVWWVYSGVAALIVVVGLISLV